MRNHNNRKESISEDNNQSSLIDNFETILGIVIATLFALLIIVMILLIIACARWR